MDEQLQQQIIQLVQAAMQGDQKATQQIQQIMQAAQQGNQEAAQVAQMIQYVAQQMQEQRVESAKFGAKLNYIKSLRGQCPDGYQTEYFKSGGKVCKKCVAKQKKINKAQGGTDSDTFRETRFGDIVRHTKKGNIDRQIVYNKRPAPWGNDTTYMIHTGLGEPFEINNIHFGNDRSGLGTFDKVTDLFNRAYSQPQDTTVYANPVKSNK